MNKLLQHIIDAGDVDHKVLPGLEKMQKGGYQKELPKAQWGQFINPITIAGAATLAAKAKEFFGFNEPKIVRTPASAPKRLSIRDPRKIMMTTGKPLRPNSDLVSGQYDSEHLGNLLTEAKRRNMSYNDMMNLAAMGFQETKWGRSDDNIGHTKGDFGDEPMQDTYSNFINAYNAKMKDADRLKIKDEATRLQVYNGLGKIFPSTEADYHGFKMKKIYGVEVPKGGIDLRKNPLYGKQVMDIRDNVLKRNPEFMRYMDSTYRAPKPKEEFNNGGLVKMQRVKPLVKAQAGVEYVTVDGKRMKTDSPEYKDVYQKGIGRWVGDEFVSSTKTLPEVVVTSNIKKNSLGDYSNTFNKQNPFETFYNKRYDEIKRDFTSEPRWAQISVGGWDKESRQEKVRQQIKDEYQNKYNEYVSQRLLSRSPQNNQSRNQWLSNKNFTNRELDILNSGSGSKLPQPNLYAQGAQGLYNTADMLTFGKLPELAVPGIADSEVANYNNPLLTLAPLSIPAKIIQSAYKKNYSYVDAVEGKPNDASIEEDILTDPFTWATLGGKSALTAAGRINRLANKYIPTARSFFKAANPVLNESATLAQRATAAAETINSEGSKIINRLRSPEGMQRMREMFKKADPNLTDKQLEYVIENRLQEMETARDFNWPKTYLDFGDKPAFSKYLGNIEEKIFPKGNAHFSPENINPLAPQPKLAPKSMVSGTFDQPPTNIVINPKTGEIDWNKSVMNVQKPHAYEDFVNPHFDPGQITLGTGLELNKNVAAHEFMHALQGSGVTPVDQELRSLIKVDNPFDKIWNVAARLDPELKRDFRYFQKGSGRKEPYPFMEELRNRMLNRGIISNPYENITAGKLFRTRLDALKQGDANFKEGTRLIKFVAPWKYKKLAGIMNTAPAIIPGIGAAALAGSSDTENNQQFKKGGVIIDPRGQWAHPGKVTRIPGSDITMQGVSYPVYGVGSNGQEQMMYPGQEYNFGGASYVDEYPIMGNGGYTVTRSNDRKGKTHKVTGPDGTVKYFGDSKLGQHPKDPERKAAFYARHKKNLAGNPFFRAFARKTWEDGGQTDYMQGGGLWNTDKVAYLDSTVNANRNLDFIRRAIENDGLSIPTPKGAPGYGKGMTSSHLMTYDPKSRRSYPELVNINGTLKYLTGDDAYNYAEDTGEYIQFPTAEQANYFSQNYKKSNYVKVGKQPLEKKHGIKVTYKK